MVSFEIRSGGRRERTYAHGEGTAEVVEDDPRAGIASVIHGFCVCWSVGRGSRESRKTVLRRPRPYRLSQDRAARVSFWS